MNIAVISDIHLECRVKGRVARKGHTTFFGSFSLPTKLEADAIVIAGDIHPSLDVRNQLVEDLEKHYRVPVIICEGNHDRYHTEFFDYHKTVNIDGVTFAIATLWTYLHVEDIGRSRVFADFVHINHLTFDRWNLVHKQHADFLLSDQADVVVSHHAPCRLSITDKYKFDPFNHFYVTDYTLALMDLKKTKLWIHGHVHSRHDYNVGDVRVVCNPLGYPAETIAQTADIITVKI